MYISITEPAILWDVRPGSFKDSNVYDGDSQANCVGTAMANQSHRCLLKSGFVEKGFFPLQRCLVALEGSVRIVCQVVSSVSEQAGGIGSNADVPQMQMQMHWGG